MKYLIFLLSFLSILTNCSTENTLEPEKVSLVVQAYIFEGEKVQEIKLSESLSLGSDDDNMPPVNDAIVLLLKNDQTFQLSPSAGDSGYYQYPSEDLSVEAGDVFTLEIEYNNEFISAQTTVPLKPQNVTMSSDTLYISEEMTFPNFSEEDSSKTIFVSWKQEDALFYVYIENIEENPDSVDTDTGFRGMNMMRGFMSSPTPSNEYNISRSQISCYGQHVLRVYRVNQEYADLYFSRIQDSRDLNEPLTNVNNGLGVFCAFNYEQNSFYVKKED